MKYFQKKFRLTLLLVITSLSFRLEATALPTELQNAFEVFYNCLETQQQNTFTQAYNTYFDLSTNISDEAIRAKNALDHAITETFSFSDSNHTTFNTIAITVRNGLTTYGFSNLEQRVTFASAISQAFMETTPNSEQLSSVGKAIAATFMAYDNLTVQHLSDITKAVIGYNPPPGTNHNHKLTGYAVGYATAQASNITDETTINSIATTIANVVNSSAWETTRSIANTVVAIRNIYPSMDLDSIAQNTVNALSYFTQEPKSSRNDIIYNIANATNTCSLSLLNVQNLISAYQKYSYTTPETKTLTMYALGYAGATRIEIDSLIGESNTPNLSHTACINVGKFIQHYTSQNNSTTPSIEHIQVAFGLMHDCGTRLFLTTAQFANAIQNVHTNWTWTITDKWSHKSLSNVTGNTFSELLSSYLSATGINSSSFTDEINALKQLYQRTLLLNSSEVIDDEKFSAFYLLKDSLGLSNAQAVRYLLTQTPEGKNTQFIVALYQCLLGREPDLVGAKNWASFAYSEAPDQQSLAYGFLESNEFSATRNINNGSSTPTKDQLIKLLKIQTIGMQRSISDLSGKSIRIINRLLNSTLWDQFSGTLSTDNSQIVVDFFNSADFQTYISPAIVKWICNYAISNTENTSGRYVDYINNIFTPQITPRIVTIT